MAKKNKEGQWEFEPEEEAQIEILARARVRADDLRAEREAAKKCPKCGKEKHEGECEKKKKTTWGE